MNALYFDEFRKIILIMTNNSGFLLCKILSNNLKSEYLNAWAIQFILCFRKLYFVPIIQTQIESINQQLLIDVVGLIKLCRSQHEVTK